MNRLAAALAALLFAGLAQAADIPPAAPVQRTAVVAPAWSWTGVYAGLNAGYGMARASAFGFSEDLDGFVGGGQVGGNWQNGPLVVGLEADFQGTTQSKSTSVTVLGVTVTEKDSVPWFGTVRGRIGAAFDRLLVYGTGGWAYAQFNVDVTALGVALSSSTSKGAFVYGGGAEYRFADRWSAKVEYIRLDTGDTNVTLFGVPFTAKLTDNVVRAGVNYHF
jgi:outer membrane immunogenic protein